MDSLFVSVPSDSAGLFTWVRTILPGLDPAIVMVLVGWLATRGVFILRYLPNIFKFVGPEKLSKFSTDINKVWTKAGWIINPALMYLLGMTVTGSGPLSILFTFAGIGVREWLIKSPIPTSQEELKKLKSKMAILIALVAVCFASVANAQVNQFQTQTPTYKSLTDRISLAAGGGYTANFKNDNQDSYPFVAARVGYIISGHLKVEVEPRFILDNDQFTSVSFAGYITF